MRKQKCVTPTCLSKTIIARGLCSGCYQAASRLVREHRKTWAELEQNKPPLAKPLGANRGGKLYQAAVGTK